MVLAHGQSYCDWVAGWATENRSSISGRSRDFLLPVHTGSGVLPASCPVGTGFFTRCFGQSMKLISHHWPVLSPKV